MEEWKKVPGFDYAIDVSTKEGRCKNLKTGKVLSNTTTGERFNWALWKNGKRTMHQAARWIALTFPVQNEYFEGAVIDHINTDAMDNRPCNLRWVTPKGNQNNPLTKKHLSETQHNRKDQSKKVMQYSKDGLLLNTYQSTMEAQRQTGIPSQNISACCLGKKYKSAGGYIWKYE